jgi:MFS family permease
MVRPLVGFAYAPWHVLLVRVGDRVGKGIRTSPRDALIAGATDPSIRARAYGFHRAMDHAGAAMGTLLAAGLLWYLGAGNASAANADQLRIVFFGAAVPGFIAMGALIITREPPNVFAATSQMEAMPPALKRALLPITLFAFANATDAFILVKAARLGAPLIIAPFLWLVLHIVKASTATAGGRLADTYGKRKSLALGWTVYSVTWAAVGFSNGILPLFVLTAVYGTSHGLVEGAEKALIAELAGGKGKGKAFGIYNMMIGFAALIASTTFGAIWDTFGNVVAFTGSGAVALLAAIILIFQNSKDFQGHLPH